MLIIQLTGLSGAGKTTIAENVKKILQQRGYTIEIIDGDAYRKTICKDLGFTKEDRQENIRRLGKIAYSFAKLDTISIIAAINPYKKTRKELKELYNAKIVWVDCDLKTLIQRDTKGLYKRALLADGHPDKIFNLTGINDTYEIPENPDLIIQTHSESLEDSVEKLLNFITANLIY
jgi:adenylylsulfate kinase